MIKVVPKGIFQSLVRMEAIITAFPL